MLLPKLQLGKERDEEGNGLAVFSLCVWVANLVLLMIFVCFVVKMLFMSSIGIYETPGKKNAAKKAAYKRKDI